MVADVFISYATADRSVADRVCTSLETENIKCWMAPRDISPGQDWSRALVEAIKSVRILVVLLSSQSANSKHVPREVEQADRNGKTIIPIYIGDFELSGHLAYYLQGLQAIRSESPLESLDELLRTVQAGLVKVQNGPEAPVPKDNDVDDNDYVALARSICHSIHEQLSDMATAEDALTIAEPLHGKEVKFIDLASNRVVRRVVSQWENRHATRVYLMGEDIDENFPPRTSLPIACVLDSLDGTQHWLRRKNLYCTALSIFARTAAPSGPFRLRVSAIQRPDGTLLVAREDVRSTYVDGEDAPIVVNVRNAAMQMDSAHVCTVSRRPDHYRILVSHLASGSPFSGLYTFGGNPALADLTLGAYDAVFQPDASSIGDSQPIWDWLPGGHIFARAGGCILALDGSPLDVIQAAEASMNAGDGHYPYVAAHTVELATTIARWLSSHSQS